MASFRRTGTNENISTYNSGGGKDYSDLGTWEAATDNDLVTATTSEIVECDAGTHADTVDMNGATTSALYLRIVRPTTAASYATQGGGFLTYSNFPYFTNSGIFNTMRVVDDYSWIQDVIATNTKSDASPIWAFSTNQCAFGGLAGCIAVDSNNPGAGDGNGYSIRTSIDQLVIECFAYNCELKGFDVFSSSTVALYNCGEFNCVTSLTIEAGSTCNSKNCVLPNGITNNGTHNQTTNITTNPTYKDSGNLDFHLAYNDTTAKGQGTDLSADGTFAFDDDIDGKIRSNWDVGWDQYSPNIIFKGTNLRTTARKINGINTENIRKINGVD